MHNKKHLNFKLKLKSGKKNFSQVAKLEILVEKIMIGKNGKKKILKHISDYKKFNQANQISILTELEMDFFTFLPKIVLVETELVRILEC
jgi:hypothetical protein